MMHQCRGMPLLKGTHLLAEQPQGHDSTDSSKSSGTRQVLGRNSHYCCGIFRSTPERPPGFADATHAITILISFCYFVVHRWVSRQVVHLATSIYVFECLLDRSTTFKLAPSMTIQWRGTRSAY